MGGECLQEDGGNKMKRELLTSSFLSAFSLNKMRQKDGDKNIRGSARSETGSLGNSCGEAA
jgi:hypothetical protein